MGRSLSLVALVIVVASACSVDRAPLGAASAAAGTTAAGGAGGTGAVGGTGGVGGVGATGGFGGVGAVGATGGVGAVGATGGVGAVGGTGGVLPDASVDAGPIGYEPGRIGAPCKDSTDCEADRASRTCISQNALQPVLVLPGGYCTTLCDVGLSCEAGSTCITIPTFPPVFACMRQCTSNDQCRVDEGYSCNKPFTAPESVCSLAN